MKCSEIKLCIFDVDGVLVNSRELHFPATQSALADYGYEYTFDEDESFGTIPTKQKLQFLSEYGYIKDTDVDKIWERKDEYLCDLFDEKIIINKNIKNLFEYLKVKNINISLASNARYSFLDKVINKLDVSGYIDLVLSAQSISPKPNPEIYLNSMKYFNILPEQTLIFEDSEIGKQAAYLSGAFVYEVSSFDELEINLLSDKKFLQRVKRR